MFNFIGGACKIRFTNQPCEEDPTPPETGVMWDSGISWDDDTTWV